MIMSQSDEDLEWEPSGRFKQIMEKDEVTPMDLKEALMECYINASGGDDEIAVNILKKQFKEAGASWREPTVSEIKEVMDRLADISEDFRDEELVKENYQKMMKLIRKKMDDMVEL